MAAAQRSGYRWPTLCHGDGTCSICWAEVTSGADHLSALGELESATLNLLSSHLTGSRTVRLACQARVYGDIGVRKSGVRSSDTTPE